MQVLPLLLVAASIAASAGRGGRQVSVLLSGEAEAAEHGRPKHSKSFDNEQGGFADEIVCPCTQACLTLFSLTHVSSNHEARNNIGRNQCQRATSTLSLRSRILCCLKPIDRWQQQASLNLEAAI